MTELNKLKQCKTLKSDKAWRLLAGEVLDCGMGLSRFLCAVDYLMTKFKYSTFQFADLLEYDEQVQVYKIADLRDRATNASLIGKTFCQIRYNGWRGVWVEKIHAENFGAHIYGEMTVEAEEGKDTREEEFTSFCSVDGTKTAIDYVAMFNRRHGTSFANYRDLYKWFMTLSDDEVRENRYNEPLCRENRDVKFL